MRNNKLWNFNTNVLLEDNSELLHKCCGWELIMTDVQCREERGRKYSLYNTPLSPSFPPLQSPTSPLPVRSLLDLMHAGLLLVLLCVFHLAVHLLFPTSSSSARDHLILYILTISQQPRPTHSQRPPIKLAQGSTQLFGSFPSSPWASCPSQSMGGGQATMLAFQTKIYFRS